MRRGAKPAKAKVEAKLPAARKSRKNEGSRVRDLEKRLAEALGREAEAQEQQAATAEILRVISSLPADAQPVFDAIAVNALRLCDAEGVVVARYDGALLHVAAHHNVNRETVGRLERQYPQAPDRHVPLGRAVLEGAVVHVPDLQTAAEFSGSVARQLGAGSHVSIPLLCQGRAVGGIGISRRRRGPFSDSQIALLQTFADQAVIAIENVRLFNETKEALEQQTATAEILRVISTSPTNLQPVLDAVVKSAARFCAAPDASIFRLDEENLRADAHQGPVSQPVGFLVPVVRGTVAGRSVLERQAVGVTDLQVETDEFPEGSSLARQTGQRATLSTPLLREGAPIGVILLRRAEAIPFTGKQIELLKTFADQAVIAIENVRLFKELQTRNQELTVALAQQTATSEVLAVISGAQIDAQPVFEAIVQSARRLCDASYSSVYRVDGQLVHLVAHNHQTPEAAEAIRGAWPMPLTGDSFVVRAIRENAVIHTDMQEDPTASAALIARGKALGHRRIVVVPMVREGQPIGAIRVSRGEATPFAGQHIALLQTFADQAVIAIENVRLFTELQEKNRALTAAHAEVTEALERQTATSEILRVISSSPTAVEPVFRTILTNANTLCNASFSVLWLWDGEALTAVAHENVSPALAENLRTARPRPHRRNPLGLSILEQTVVHVADVLTDSRFAPEDVPTYRLEGARSIMSVPMIREGSLVGVINVWRREPRAFTEGQIELLKTFADEAVIAIANARLFTELQEKNRALTQAHWQVTEALEQQTATSEILRVIAGSPRDLQPVLDALVESASRLCQAADTFLLLVEEDQLRVAALHGSVDESARLSNTIHRGWVAGRAVVDARTVHVEDLANAEAEFTLGAAIAARLGHRTALAIPLLRKGVPIGALFLRRREVRQFSDKEIALLETFADQAVIAIENVRLFTELASRNRELTEALDQQTATAEILRVISSSPTDVEPVFAAIVRSAVRLCGGTISTLYRYDGHLIHLGVTSHPSGLPQAITRGQFPRPADTSSLIGRAIVERAVVNVADMETDPRAHPGIGRVAARERGFRSMVIVPMYRKNQVVGVITVGRAEPGQFSDADIALLQTFADQSVIAIENVRLFKELEASNREIAEKSRQIEIASHHKSEFLANMSHELRTPLNAIIGFSEVLTERMFGDLNEKQEEYLKDIYASGTHLLSLINDILDLSKIEAGRMELELTDFDLPTALDSALTLVRERAGRRGITLQATVDKRLGEVRADERKIRQVVLNLLSNAIKFTPEGGRIAVRAVPVDGSVEVSVSDTGVGIAPEDQEAVFEEFRQVGTSAAKQEGTGLGLALCRKFLELHGGKIWVTSQVGVGSTFTFTIPVRRGE